MSSPSPNLHHLTDFSDRISPMLVKELRQGMRTHLFTIAFILLQAFMVLCVLIGAAAAGDAGAVSGFFWFFVVVALVIVQPVRGFSALTQEIQLNTMDLIHLTELGAWRITLGKWAALVAQTLLLVCGILPYLVMRYFFGGIDLVRELTILFWVLILSLVLTAVSVGFSAFRSVLLRLIVIVGIGIGLLVAAEVADDFLRILINPAESSATRSTIVWSFLATTVAALYVIWFMLDLGASRIAPEADNHTTRKRLVALAFGLILLALPAVGVDAEACLIIVGIVWTLVCLDAITERAVLLPSILLPFAKRWWLRPWTLLLTPGWHTGIFFFLLCVVLFVGGLFVVGLPFTLNDDEIQTMVGLAGSIVFPLLIIHLFFRKPMTPGSVFGIYLLIQCCCAVAAFFLTIMAEETPVGEVAYLILPIPMTALFAAMANDGSIEITLLSSVFAIGGWLIAFIRGVPLYRDSARMMRALRESLASRS
jgi:hypothetical protein